MLSFEPQAVKEHGPYFQKRGNFGGLYFMYPLKRNYPELWIDSLWKGVIIWKIVIILPQKKSMLPSKNDTIFMSKVIDINWKGVYFQLPGHMIIL